MTSRVLEDKFDSNQAAHFDHHYTMGEKLGEGMHASVYLCSARQDMAKRYAVKISRSDDPEKTASFKNEYEVLKDLDHPNIVKAHRIFEDSLQGEVFIVMDHKQGRDLESAITS